MRALNILGIETSCDETAVALLEYDADAQAAKITGSLVGSQTARHAQFGGIVPELASREHLKNLPLLLGQLQARAGFAWEQLDAVAVTGGPGLAPCLVLGHTFARTLGLALDKPVRSVNHLEGHLLSPWLGAARPVRYPFVGLIVSGGHTLLILARAPGVYERLGGTVDDAAGEAFDKIARLLGLPYPGGPALERCARDGGGDPAAHAFPRSFPQADNFNFSFSGLKTSVRYYVEKHPEALESARTRADLCASVQEAICAVLERKALAACQASGVGALAVSGGVACNGRLRELLAAGAAQAGVELLVAPPELCTDNAAMIAFVAAHRQDRGLAPVLLEEIHPSWPLAAATDANKVPMPRA